MIPTPPTALPPASPRQSGEGRRRFRTPSVRPVLTAAAIAVVFGAGVGADRVLWRGGPIAGAASSFTESEEFAVLETTWELIHTEYADPEAVDDGALVYGAAEGMVDALGDDGHSRFLDPEGAADFEEATRGEFTGVGIEIDIPGDRPVVVAPIDGSPAAEAGVRSGDTILAIDGETTERLEQEEIGELIRGDAGTSVRLTLLHRGELTPYEVTVVRRTITLRPVSWRMLPGGVAQVRLAEFSVGATRELEAALDAAHERGATGVVLDLRDNPGGLVAEAVGVASQFMPEGRTIFRQQERDEEAKPLATVGTTGRWLDGPLVVLVNNGSASAAEIVGAALRDNDRAVLLGETTYGTGTVLIPFEQPDGSVVLLGTALWLTADGVQIWREGVAPDRTIRLPAAATPSRPSADGEVTPAELAALDDVQLRAAVVELTGVALPRPLPAPPSLPYGRSRRFPAVPAPSRTAVVPDHGGSLPPSFGGATVRASEWHPDERGDADADEPGMGDAASRPARQPTGRPIGTGGRPMTEQDRERDNNADVSTPPSGDAVTETSEETPSVDVRDVIGRRGYDEGEDETANEDEEH